MGTNKRIQENTFLMEEEKLKHWDEFGPTIKEYIEGLKMWGLIKDEDNIS